ncbi:hypothetical protein FRC14_005921 [Serendipita sp. 396]|nr:hypothetical protein FRC14_005921 [Serendipita sp. 396]KAG8787029.1 hypothetical protein FRC15_010190 [Serendipita sp. 397]KAG8801840.1 hypothetical protein FRC16_010975 [Serendipita sp. 398]
MSDAWDFGVAAAIQLLRAGISYLKVDAPYVLDVVAFSLAIVEGSILSNTLPDRRRLTLYPAVMLVLRILLDFISGANNKNAIWGMAGTLGGLLLGPVFHGPEAASASEEAAKADPSSASSAGVAPSLAGGASTIRGLGTPLSTPRRVSSPPKPVMHHVIDVDKETHQPILFTPAMSLRSLDEPSTMMLGSDGRSRTRVEDSFSSDDMTIKYEHYIVGDDEPSTTAGDTIYQDALDTTSHGPLRHQRQQRTTTVKDNVRKLRAQAKNDDINRRNLLQEREQVLHDGDVARAFLLKHQAEMLKKSMMESDQEAARTIFEYYNPPGRRERAKVDLRGLQASEAIKYCDEALRELQDAGGNMLMITVGKGKNVDGNGKGKVKPTLRQYAKAQGIRVEEIEDGSVLVLTLPTLQSPVAYA